MKREIKFKVFDRFTVDKSIRLVGYEKLNKDGNWEYKREGRDEYILGTISDNQGNVIFTRVQYTGLKDKNGVEIYEGDIVRWGLGFTGEWDKESWHRYAKVEMFPSLQFDIIYYINAEDGAKKPTDGHIFEFGRFAYKETEKYLEVIGNIFESHELLEQS